MQELDLYQLQTILIERGFDYGQLGHIFCSAVGQLDHRDLSSSWRKNRLANAAHTRFQDNVRRKFAYAKNLSLSERQSPDEILEDFYFSYEYLSRIRKQGTIEGRIGILLTELDEEKALSRIGQSSYDGAKLHHEISDKPSRRLGQEYIKILEILSEEP